MQNGHGPSGQTNGETTDLPKIAEPIVGFFHKNGLADKTGQLKNIRPPQGGETISTIPKLHGIIERTLPPK
ncbi:hypothetical protein COV23_00065 [Candidatus Wolfebacteria bacterium CG10_big_fil_rev_8_21_14_0_10_31_9]|uniref:Uncharacterized protein n=1 Tax=Candidatus Wolfebacteria bacterium CG10_big_fil_rev_8_21_14_0_10_31_9 TaxID=1975070 RepID=A0A2H0RCW7_9BACT|nr:MAG: hypothetical protein COV23_00065 [Candidatus Wolfebacteria bacterium CG10_big_fil_rev_8_21_14_0_10_31_9]